jgi:hypothetical protein
MFGQQAQAPGHRKCIDQLTLLINALLCGQGKPIGHLKEKVGRQPEFEQTIAGKLKNVIKNLALRSKGDIVTEDWDVHKNWILMKLGKTLRKTPNVNKFENSRLRLVIRFYPEPEFPI